MATDCSRATVCMRLLSVGGCASRSVWN